jgi:RNA polymerase sigma factor (sigma-70 family)
MSTKTAGELACEFVSGSSEPAFEELVSRHGRMVYQVCARILRNQHDAEDASQVVFMVLARKLGKLRNSRELSTWLFGVARNVSLRVMRGRERRNAREEAAAVHCVEMQDPQSEGFTREARDILDAEIAALPAGQRQAVVLRFLQGHSEKEAARASGSTVGLVSAQASKGLARLRERMNRKGVLVGSAAIGAFLNAESKAAVPDSLLPSLVAASKLATAGAVADGVNAELIRLMKETLRMMSWAKTRLIGATATGIAAMTLAVVMMMTWGDPGAHSRNPARGGELASVKDDKQQSPGARIDAGPDGRKTTARSPNGAGPAIPAQPTQAKGVSVVLGPPKQEVRSGAYPTFAVTFRGDGRTRYLYLGSNQLEMSIVLKAEDGAEYRYWSGPPTEPGARMHLDLAATPGDRQQVYIEYTCRHFATGKEATGVAAPGTQKTSKGPALPPGKYVAQLTIHVSQPITPAEAIKAQGTAVIKRGAPPTDMLVPDNRRKRDYFSGTLISNAVTVVVKPALDEK